ncbi:uncharacterized protein LY79DRAFT_582680 [Colletotrichum navitas]|uniref:Uncharacterized protein n=1 Tax=Colletotrichum navitas TaxID=681940 RepID=A0AAD8PSK2_9PEZI|nr:uncharacterized protein LY79DRAFT_582680 [Colletotrichum navitas]KAK1579238.1 hypothetical protein LY79DRAFT_582680 [Colletotrichum navitas]
MPAKAALPVPGIAATEAEIKLAFAVLKFMRRPNTTAVYDGIAVEAGSASGDSVRHGVRKAADKHGWFSQAPAEDPASGPATPRPKKAATPRKKKIAEVDEEDEAGTAAAGQRDEEGTPKTKRARKAKSKDKAVAAAVVTEEETSGGEKENKDGAAAAPTPVSEEE